ncbi:MAG: TonB-dependent receptor [Planctomycetes bacterium]|nr:TonB-dependent receptor [Planctomycetota bacterium]
MINNNYLANLRCIIKKVIILSLYAIYTGFGLAQTFAEDLMDDKSNEQIQITDAIEEEIRWLQAETDVAISTRHEVRISKAPGIVTVLNEQEINYSGYRTFSELLRTIPGYEILKSEDFGSVVPAVRGLEGANRVRVMINGHLVNNPLDGSAFGNFDDFPLENIKKIEIIRGPGSALYGENAFLSVINIITKDAADIDGIFLDSGFGSYDTLEENIVFGKRYGNVEVSGMMHYRDTNGYDGTIESDSQSVLDNSLSPFGFPAVSQAPGEVEDWRREYSLNLKMAYKDVYFQGWYNNKNRGPFVGPQHALTDESDIESNYVFAEVGYKKTFEEIFTIKPRVYYDQFDNDSYVESLPEGTTLSFDTDSDGSYDTFNTYKDGLIGNGKVIQRVVGAEIPFDYELFDSNILTLGFEYRHIKQSDIQYSANFDPLTLDPLDSMKDFTDTYPFLEETTRNIWSVYIQDTWDITNNVSLTLGARHDEYNDFGEATSPRLGFTWKCTENATLKLLYGEAFRAPSFLEMFTVNQPAILGNEDLDPELIRTTEMGLTYAFNKYITSSISYFNNNIKDLITLRALDDAQETWQYDNFGDAHIQGFEAETKINISQGNYVFFNYTYQDPEDDHGNELPFVAKHKGNIGINAQPCKYVNTNLSAFFSGKRYREEDDSRDDMSSYALVNLSVIGKEFFRTMNVQGTVFNVLDKDYEDPGTVSISEDLPRPGRTYFVGLSYQF